jgi:hypothetical protein
MILDAGCWMLDAGSRILDPGSWILDPGCDNSIDSILDLSMGGLVPAKPT